MPRSLSITLASVIVLLFTLSTSGCELISSVDRSLIPSAGGVPTDNTANGGSTSNGGGDAATGGTTLGAGGRLQGEAGESPASGGQSQASGGGSQAAAGQTQAAAGQTQGAAGDTSAGGSTEETGGVGGVGAGSGSGGVGVSGGGGGGGGTPVGKIIYLTSMPKKANFGGVNGADAQCNLSPPTAGTYKALLVDGTTRVACTTAQCATGGATEGVDWVLAPNTKYVRADGTTVIGTSSSSAIFAFPLDASIGTIGYSYWTGLNADWTTSTDTCSGWTQTSDVFASEGSANTSDNAAIAGVNEGCAMLAGAFFACVEQ